MSDPLPVGAPVDGTPARDLRGASLRGQFVELRRVAPERDARELFPACHGSPEKDAVWTYMAYGPFDSAGAMQDWLEDCAASADPRFFTVVERTSGRAVGVVSYLAIRAAHRSVEVGNIWYLPEVQRGTTNSETVYLLMREAFDRGHRRVEWKCDSLNERSRRAALRLGFHFEGVFRQHLIIKGRNRDTAWFSLLDSEWPAARAALEAWLGGKEGSRPSLASLREEESECFEKS